MLVEIVKVLLACSVHRFWFSLCKSCYWFDWSWRKVF